MTIIDLALELAWLAQRQVDRVLPPSTRRDVLGRVLDFASRRPAAFAFLAILGTLCLGPTALFAAFVSTVFLVSLGAAVLFGLFWAGVALLVLIPALLAAAGLAVLAWAWVVCSFLAARSLARLLGFDEHHQLGWGVAAAAEEQDGEEEDDYDALPGKNGHHHVGPAGFDGMPLAVQDGADGALDHHKGRECKRESGYGEKKEESGYGEVKEEPGVNSRPVWAPGTGSAAAH